MWGFFLRILATVVLAGISAWLSYRSQRRPPPGTLDDIGNPRAEEGTEIAKIFGTVTIADPNVVWFGDLRTRRIEEEGGRKYGLFGPKQKTTIGYEYFLGVHFVLCLGPIDNLSRIRVDKREAFFGASTGGLILIRKPTLFGSRKTTGGINGDLNLLLGEDDQAVNDYLAAKTSSPTPAYRGVTSLVLRQVYIGNAPTLRPWDMRVQRITACDPGYNGGTQWYPEKATILREEAGDPVPIFGFNETWQFANVAYSTAPPSSPDPEVEYEEGVFPGPFIYNLFSEPEPVDPDIWTWIYFSPAYWVKRTFTVSQSGVFRISGQCENSQGIYIDGTLVFNPNPDNLLNGSPFDYSVDVVLGAGPHTIHVYFRDDVVEGNAFLSTKLDYIGVNTFDMNPVHILREVLLSPDTGGTGNEAEAGTTWTAAADTIYAEQFGISIAWRGDTDRVEFKREIERHIDARTYIDRRTGLWEIKLIRDDYEIETLPVFDTSNVISWSNINFPQPASLINQLVVTWNDPAKEEKTSLTISNPARIRASGSKVFQEKVEYLGIHRQDLAGRVAMRDLSARSAPLVTGEFSTKTFPTNLNLGSAIIVNNPRLKLINKVVRVTEIIDGTIRDSATTVKFIEDKFAINDESSLDIEIIEPEIIVPLPVDPRLVEEAPLYLLTELLGEANVVEVFTLDPEAGFVFIAGGEPTPTSFDAATFRDIGTGYEELETVAFSPEAFTLGSMTNRADHKKVVVESSEDLTVIAVGAKVWLGGEQLVVELVEEGDTSGPGDYWESTEAATLDIYTLTLTRGTMDTVPIAHAVGSQMLFYDSGALLIDDIQTDGDVIAIKLLTNEITGVLDIGDAPIDTVTMSSRALRPYPPGDLRLDGDYETNPPPELSGYVLTWEHRDRTLGTLDGHEVAGPGTPEAGTTYLVRVEALDANGDVLATLTSTNVGDDLTYTWTPVAAPTGSETGRMSVASIRDSLESWTRPSIAIRLSVGERGIEDGEDTRATEDADDNRTIEG
jgi:hypothetical protein